MIFIPRKLTHNEFIKKFHEKNSNANNIDILEQYIVSSKKIKCKCKICGYIWRVLPRDLLHKNVGCVECFNKRRGDNRQKTHEEFIKELAEKNPNIEVMDKYTNVFVDIECKCKICNHIWKVKPYSVLQKHGCPMCANKHRNDSNRKTHEKFIKELTEKNSDIEVLEKYTNRTTKILCKCKIDGYEWEVTPASLLQGTGCPSCNSSKGEKKIKDFLNKINQSFIYDEPYFKDLYGVNNGLLRPDFIIEDKKIWIEYDGKGHFEPINWKGQNQDIVEYNFKIAKYHDELKNKYAKENGWKLIRIPYWDFDNIEEILNKEFL